MRKTLTAMALAAGLIGFGVAAQAAPVPASPSLPGMTDAIATPVQMMRRERMMRRDRMERRMHHRRMERRMMRREMRHDMRRDMRRRGY